LLSLFPSILWVISRTSYVKHAYSQIPVTRPEKKHAKTIYNLY
jgi:hypothetical protein